MTAADNSCQVVIGMFDKNLVKDLVSSNIFIIISTNTVVVGMFDFRIIICKILNWKKFTSCLATVWKRRYYAYCLSSNLAQSRGKRMKDFTLRLF